MSKSASTQPANPTGNPLARTSGISGAPLVQKQPGTAPISTMPLNQPGSQPAANGSPFTNQELTSGQFSPPTTPTYLQGPTAALYGTSMIPAGAAQSNQQNGTAPGSSAISGMQPNSPDSGGFNASAVQAATPQPTGYQPGQNILPNTPQGAPVISNNQFGQFQNQISGAENAAYKNATGYLDPQFANQQTSLQNSLINQGIPQNSEAWNKAMDDFGRQKQFAYQQAQSNAYGQGVQSQGQLASQILQQLGYTTSQNIANIGASTSANYLAEQGSQNNFNNSMQTRQQDLNELLLQQKNPLDMANSLTNGSNVQQPNFTQTPGASVGGTDIASIIQQALGQQNNVYNTQVGAQNSQTSGMTSIIAALLSDRRLKTNIRKIGMHRVGVPLYLYNYVWGEPGIGVMADELQQVLPAAVFETASGYLAVNYAAISEAA